jgi:hypothetical protein
LGQLINKIKEVLKMKKILALFVILSMAFMSLPAVADDPCPPCEDPFPTWDDDNCYEPVVDTIANVVGCGGNPNGGGTTGGTSGGALEGAPIIKCKWEYDLDVSLPPADPCCEDYCTSHDACPYTEGLQVKPILEGFVTVGFYAIVTDPQGPDHVDRVYADVWHPDGEFKYQIELFPVGFDSVDYDKSQALSEWEHVTTWHHDLINYGPEWDIPNEAWSWDDDIYDELIEEKAYLYFNTAQISYCQPAGDYTVGVTAYDGLDMWCDYVFNTFWYIPTAAIDIDFDTVDYGDVVESTWAPVGGDKVMGTSNLPTVKNIGNVPVELSILQDDMGFGVTTNQGIEYPNVEYKARMNEDGLWTAAYIPDVETMIPGVLGMCTEDKLDFKIHVLKGFPDGDPNEGTMTLCAHIYGDQADWISPLQFANAPQGVPQNIS